MKKVLSILLAGLLILCAGCGGTAQNGASAETNESSAESSQAESEAAEAADTETEAADAEAEEAGETEAAAMEAGVIGDLLFDTTDLDGNPVHSADLYAENKITMINVWATWCGPCVGEMPELAVMAEEFAEQDVGLIAVCTDAVDEATVADAKDILAAAGADFPVLAGFEGQDALFQLYAFPTTFFVDSEGHVLGSIIGAAPQEYRNAVAQLLKNME